MKQIWHIRIWILAMLIGTLISCRTEEVEIINPPQEETLKVNTPIALLIKNTVTNDGSIDNIIDKANCFTIQLPVTVFANGTEVTVNTPNDYFTVETIFDQFETDTDILTIQFPITIILSNYRELEIHNITELEAQAQNCNGENEIDDDIECVDFQYPISASVFNANNEQLRSVTFNNDNDFYDFIENMNENDLVQLNFPIAIILPDASVLQIDNLTTLENTIENYKDACDEDDDNDYNDDDCNDCTDNQLVNVLTTCTDWNIDKLEINDVDLEDNYTGYVFTFLNNNTITVVSGTNTYTGTWSVIGSGNDMSLVINITGLTDFNGTWHLHEIDENDNEKEIDLLIGNDRLCFKSNC